MILTRRLLALFFISLLVIPQGRKLLHEFDHLDSVHCNVHERHFCAAEHTCSLCDFVFSAAARPPQALAQASAPMANVQAPLSHPERFLLSPRKYHLLLRGPPQAA